jgi:hypothetical protein
MNIKTRILGILMIGAMAATLSVVGAGVAHAESAFHPIRNTWTGMCLQPQSVDNFAPIVQMDCNGDLQIQRWYMDKLATNHYRIVNQATGLCFNAFDGAFNGARILQVDCVPISNEEFNTGAPIPGDVKLESRVRFRDNGYCIGVPGAASIAGLAVVLFTCGTSLGQQWSVGSG